MFLDWQGVLIMENNKLEDLVEYYENYSEEEVVEEKTEEEVEEVEEVVVEEETEEEVEVVPQVVAVSIDGTTEYFEQLHQDNIIIMMLLVMFLFMFVFNNVRTFLVSIGGRK